MTYIVEKEIVLLIAEAGSAQESEKMIRQIEAGLPYGMVLCAGKIRSIERSGGMNLKLEKVWEHTKIRLGDNTTIVKEIYEIGHYEVERTTETYEDATTKEWFRTGRDTAAEFIPEIDFQSVDGEREFVAITPGSWEVTADELKQLIAGYQEAAEVIRVLTEAFIKKGVTK